MLPQEIIRRKRDRQQLTAEEIAEIVSGLVTGRVTEAQAAAFAMAAFLNGLDREETVALTRAMTRSGTVLDWSGADGPVLDKHSTGGVGDKVSLLLAPLVAAAGGVVPMISGRGLGHTGGTLDKLDSIPGYRSQPGLEDFRKAVKAAGAAIIGQTDDLAPADRRLYAVRDISGTVESIPLITASILSKKLAAGLGGLVMDVKVGSGAFMETMEEARELARSIVEVAGGAGLPAKALITDMNEVLGRTAGNAVEVAETVAALTDPANADRRLVEVTIALGAEMLVLGGLAPDPDAAAGQLRRLLESGAAAERFQAMVSALGGPGDLLEKPGRHLADAPVTLPLPAAVSGTVQAIDVRQVGLAVIELGGGRTASDQQIDHRVGLSAIAGIGAVLEVGDPLALIHAADEATASAVVAGLRDGDVFRLGSASVDQTGIVLETLAHDDP